MFSSAIAHQHQLLLITKTTTTSSSFKKKKNSKGNNKIGTTKCCCPKSQVDDYQAYAKKAICTASLALTLMMNTSSEAFAASDLPALPQPTKRSTAYKNNKTSTTTATSSKKKTSSATTISSAVKTSNNITKSDPRLPDFSAPVVVASKNVLPAGVKPLTYDASKVKRSMTGEAALNIKAEKGRKQGAILQAKAPVAKYAAATSGVGLIVAKIFGKGAAVKAGKIAAVKAAKSAAAIDAYEAVGVVVAGFAVGESGKSSIRSAKKKIRETPKGELSPGAILLVSGGIPASLIGGLLFLASALSTTTGN